MDAHCKVDTCEYSQLTDNQLLANFVSEGSAKHLLEQSGNLKHAVMYAYESELQQVPGIGKEKAKQLKAIVEIAHRLYRSSVKDSVIIRSPKDIYDQFIHTQHLRVEQFSVLYLNTKNAVISKKVISQGTVNAAIVTPREVFEPAVRLLSTSVILTHNHPSGVPDPSPEDKEITQRIVEAGKALAIDVLDHIIIGSGSYFSFQEQGLMPS